MGSSIRHPSPEQALSHGSGWSRSAGDCSLAAGPRSRSGSRVSTGCNPAPRPVSHRYREFAGALQFPRRPPTQAPSGRAPAGQASSKRQGALAHERRSAGQPDAPRVDRLPGGYRSSNPWSDALQARPTPSSSNEQLDERRRMSTFSPSSPARCDGTPRVATTGRDPSQPASATSPCRLTPPPPRSR